MSNDSFALAFIMFALHTKRYQHHHHYNDEWKSISEKNRNRKKRRKIYRKEKKNNNKMFKRKIRASTIQLAGIFYWIYIYIYMCVHIDIYAHLYAPQLRCDPSYFKTIIGKRILTTQNTVGCVCGTCFCSCWSNTHWPQRYDTYNIYFLCVSQCC